MNAASGSYEPMPGFSWLESALSDRLSVVLAENLRYRKALKDIATYSREPHKGLGDACGEDACLICLIEGTAQGVLTPASREQG